MPAYTFDGVAPNLPSAGTFWLAPNADIIGRVSLAEDVSIWFGAVLRGDIEAISIGHRSNVQDLSVMHTDAGFPLSVGRNCTIGHRALLHGCQIGDNTLIGMGAVIMTGARIGANCIIGAHTLVPEHKQIPDHSLVVGVPGRIVRDMTDEDVSRNAAAAERYVARWKDYSGPGFSVVPKQE
jgi:carbonic anhydrase/acetyltransferase-like protein (isoleucine patch superfamily)